MDNEINEMIERVLIQRNKTVDDMILGEIRKIATENGIDTIITLNDKAIIQALKNFAEVKHGKWKRLNGKDEGLYECSNCYNLAWRSSAYCPLCGAKMDGGKAE
jgi:rubrerythrin